jgi:hypothetical protein
VKLPAEISEEIDIGKNLLLVPLDFLEFLTLVVGHFDLRGLKREPRIPSAPLRPAETVSQGPGMREGSVDNVGVRKTENEFPNGNAGKKPSFAEEAVVGGSFKLEQRSQIIGIIGQPRENTVVFVAEAGGDQAMRVITRHIGKTGKHLLPSAA